MFTEIECKQIIELGIRLGPKESIINQEAADHRYRKSENSWIHFNDVSKWLYDRLAQLVRQVNREFWNFELRGFYSHTHFTKYNPGDFYDWHKDFRRSELPRKLSAVVQLFRPTGLGDALFFPSSEWHRVTPVTLGTRFSLVTWVS